jgi:hypothetical protein
MTVLPTKRRDPYACCPEWRKWRKAIAASRSENDAVPYEVEDIRPDWVWTVVHRWGHSTQAFSADQLAETGGVTLTRAREVIKEAQDLSWIYPSVTTAPPGGMFENGGQQAPLYVGQLRWK